MIADALIRHDGNKPILVLTHTNAGVVALRSRLDLAGVLPRAYRLSTIDGWAMRLISTFPARSAHDPALLELANPGEDYPDIRAAAGRLLRAGHVTDIISASYSRLIVDEYQLTLRPAACICSAHLPINPDRGGGRPFTSYFRIGQDELADWDSQVGGHFPMAGELSTPWRWINAGTEDLGRWLLEEVRPKLLRGERIDLATAPACVTWIELDGTEDHQRRLRAARTRALSRDGCVLIIGDSTNPESQRQIASQTPGAITVEAVDLKDLVQFGRTLNINAANALQCVAEFAQRLMTNVGAADLVQRTHSLIGGRARKPPSDVEKVAIAFVRNPSYSAATALMVEINKQGGDHTHRPAVLRACIKAFQMCGGTAGLSFLDATIQVREQNWLIGRPLPRRAVGSTLLLKGLEAEIAFVLHANELDERNLYVAMTRGSNALTLCSPTPVLRP